LTFKHDFFRSGHIYGDEPVKKEDVQDFLDEDFFSTGYTSVRQAFDVDCLNADGTRNLEYEKPKSDIHDFPLRAYLWDWFVQENTLPGLFKEIDKDFEDEAWKNLPPTVLIHSGADVDVPQSLSQMANRVIGRSISSLIFLIILI
jgi:hypothetical protein